MNHPIDSTDEVNLTPATFFRTNARAITYAEFRYEANPLTAGLAWVLTRMGVSVPTSTDDPPIADLAPFEIDDEELPPAMSQMIQPVEAELESLGFTGRRLHLIEDGLHKANVLWATYVGPGGQTFARIRYRRWFYTHPAREHVAPEFVTPFSDGSFRVSTALKPDMLPPSTVRTTRQVGATVADLLHAHEAAVADDARSLHLTPTPIRSLQEAGEVHELLHAVITDFHMQRGVFREPDHVEQIAANRPLVARQQWRADRLAQPPMLESEATETDDSASHDDTATDFEAQAGAQSPQLPTDQSDQPSQPDEQMDGILDEYRNANAKKSSFAASAWLLVGSIVAFIILGGILWDWKFAIMLIPILLVHELGHFIAMKIFGYRNVKMFFIPMLGAAVTANQMAVPGWKKVVVSLAGPLPGIVLAIPLGVAGIVLEQDWMLEAAALTAIINGFNLLPILPLDGGWVMHTLIFSRAYVLDIIFRVMASVGLVGLGILLDTKIMIYFGVFLAISIPAAIKIANIVNTLRKRGLHPPADGATEPTDAMIRYVADEVRSTFKTKQTSKSLAKLTRQVIDTVASRPPSWSTTIAYLTVHAASFAISLVVAIVFVVAQQGGLGQLFGFDQGEATIVYTPGSDRVASGDDVDNRDPKNLAHLVATFPSRGSAERQFHGLSGVLSEQASIVLFGQTVMVSLPADDQKRGAFGEMLQRDRGELIVQEPDESRMSASFDVDMADEAAAILIESQLTTLGQSLMLIPPWDPSQTITDDQRRARQTQSRLLQVRPNRDDPEFMRLNQALENAYNANASPEVIDELAEPLIARELQLQRQAYEQIAAEDNVHKDMVALMLESLQLRYASIPTTHVAGGSTIENDQARLTADAAANTNARRRESLMGVSSPDDAEAMKFRVATLWCVRSGQTVSIHAEAFVRPDHSMPALTNWLAASGAIEIRYGIGQATMWMFTDPEFDGLDQSNSRSSDVIARGEVDVEDIDIDTDDIELTGSADEFTGDPGDPGELELDDEAATEDATPDLVEIGADDSRG